MRAADAICFTSNGVIKKNGSLVMGAGVAKAFRDRFDGIDAEAGKCVKTFGNICQRVAFHIWRDDDGTPQKVALIAFPTKHHWRNPSDIKLIEKSVDELIALADDNNWNSIYIPAPGVSHGGLDWKTEVRPLLEKKLDDRFIITFYQKG